MICSESPAVPVSHSPDSFAAAKPLSEFKIGRTAQKRTDLTPAANGMDTSSNSGGSRLP